MVCVPGICVYSSTVIENTNNSGYWGLSEQRIKYVFTQPLRHEQHVTQGEIFSGVKLLWIQSFPSFWMVVKPSFKNPIFSDVNRPILFSRALARSEMQAVPSRIWTPVVNSTSYVDILWASRLGLQNTPTAYLQTGKIPPTGVLGMTLNNLMVKL